MTFGGFQYLRAPIRKITARERINQFNAMADKMEPDIARAFAEGMRQLRALIPEQELARMIEEGSVSAALGSVSDQQVSAAMQEFSAAMSQSAVAGAALAAETQPTVMGQNGLRVQFVFDPANPHVGDFAREQAAHRIREVSTDIRAVVRSVIERETMAGRNPRTTARIVRQSIGLTMRQEAAVTNYRRMLQNLDKTALERELRDRRFDSALRRAIRNQEPLSASQVNRMVDRYRERYIKYRSEVIARTESIRSLQGGARALYQSYIDDGRIAVQQVRRFWHYTHDSRTRDEHRQIPGMNPEGVGQDEPFDTPLGPLMFPGDPTGVPENVINCRCTVITRVVAPELLAA